MNYSRTLEVATQSIKVFVPSDTTARSVGADAVANAIVAAAADRCLDVQIIRNGSRGLYWLEPLVEVDIDGKRYAYGPVQANDVSGLFEAGFLTGGGHEKSLGATESLSYLAEQTRLTFARVGIIDPLSLDDYLEHGGYEGLGRAVKLEGAEIVSIVTDSGLRGRGGAAFPTGIKWKTVLEAAGDQKYVTCNADEGDSGTFADRMIMESDPFVLIEGMTIAGLAVGATQGFIYLRAEYPQAIDTMLAAIEIAGEAGYLGSNVMDSRKIFNLDVRVAAGAYICGEETSMLESLEGKRGMVRYRPPLPAIEGLFGKPTIVNNVISLATIPVIVAKGAEIYQQLGMGRSRGTLTVQLAGNIQQGGLVEVAFGRTLRELLEKFGGGSASGRPIRAVQAGGPLGAYIHPSYFDTPLDYEAFSEFGALIGHGGLVVFDDTVDMGEQARFAMEFCAIESCGKCTPCRIGAVRGVEVIDKIRGDIDTSANLELLKELCDTMVAGSLCALGGMAPYPVMSVLEFFPEDLGAA
ncbi:MAG: formate dehydrogenase beta subunit [Candidatus Rariloculaceae bacterium]